MEFIPARWFHTGRLKAIRVVVVHETISPEMGTGAEAVGAFFKAGTRKGSTQRVCDSNSTVQCVKDSDTCYGAAGANSDGLHVELVGPGNQNEAQWHDPFSTATVTEAGKTIRYWAETYDIPLRWLTVAQVADGKSRGICTHDDVSHAFPAVSTGHSDPQNFPKQWALSIWLEDVKHPDSTPIHQEGDDMFTYEYDAEGAAPNILVLVAGGKQVRITNNGVLQRRRKAIETHLGPVDKTEFDEFAKKYGAVV